MAALPKRPKGVLSKGQGASNFVPGAYSKTGKDKFQDVVSAAIDTAETAKDRANIKSVIYSAGRKYKVDAALVQKAAQAAEKMYAKPKPESKKVSNGSDTKPYNVRLMTPKELVGGKEPKTTKKPVPASMLKKTTEKMKSMPKTKITGSASSKPQVSASMTKSQPKTTAKSKPLTGPAAIKAIQDRTSPSGVKKAETGAKKAIDKKYPGLYKKSK